MKQSIVGKLLEVTEDPQSKSDTKDEHYVFYVKMKGDYYRYLSEVNQGSDRDGKYDSVAVWLRDHNKPTISLLCTLMDL